MSPSNSELQRLLRLIGETAAKGEKDAYAAGWRDCRAAILNAISSVPQQPANGIYLHEVPPPPPAEPPAENVAWTVPQPQANGTDGYTN